MPILVTIAGIDQAIASLGLTPETQKAKLLVAIRRRLADQEALAQVEEIPVDVLIADIWGEGDAAAIKGRRKSFSSLKSALNKSFKELDPQGENPEGVIIGRNNVFEPSEERKSALLNKLGIESQADGGRIADMITAFNKAFPGASPDQGMEELKGLLEGLEQARSLIADLRRELQEKDHQIVHLQEAVKGRGAGGGGDADLGGGGDEAMAMGPGGDLGTEVVNEAAAIEVVDLDADDVEVVEEVEVSGEGIGAGGGDGVSAGEGVALGLSAEDVEVVEIDELPLGGPDGGGDSQGGSDFRQSPLLEVLSKYLDPDQALGQVEVLNESEEGLVAQLLDRFTPKFIKIPAGVYPFGCRNPIPGEHPLQEVAVTSYYLGQYPVTNDLFELFVRETGYETDAERAGFGLVHEGLWQSRMDPDTGLASFSIRHGAAAVQVSGANWRHPLGPGSSLENRHNHPVVQVSFRDAQAFAAWAGKRLPSEGEWEVAARSEDGRLFPWGGDWVTDRANLGGSCLGETTPVERYRDKGKSPFGIVDMLGNVYEWTATRDQPDGKFPRWILKGGCWNSRGIISACHRNIQPETWSNIIGFRLAV